MTQGQQGYAGAIPRVWGQSILPSSHHLHCTLGPGQSRGRSPGGLRHGVRPFGKAGSTLGFLGGTSGDCRSLHGPDPSWPSPFAVHPKLSQRCLSDTLQHKTKALDKALRVHSVMSDSFAIPWTVAHQALLSVGFSRQEY